MTNVMRAKMRLVAEKIYADTAATGAKVYTFQAQYSNSPEDNSYSKYTPSAQFEMTIDNPVVQAALKLGEVYYVDFTPASFPNVQKVAEYISKTAQEPAEATYAIAFNNNPVETPLAQEAANLISQEEQIAREGTGLTALRDEPLTSEPYHNTPNPNLPPKSAWVRPQDDFGEDRSVRPHD